jgi:hypothetical protein
MLFPQAIRCLCDVSHLPRSVAFIIDATIGETSESAVRVEVNLFRPVIPERSLRITDDCLNAFYLFRPRINNAQSDFAVCESFPNHIDVACPRCCIFQDKLRDSNLLKTGDKRLVISGKKHFFGSAPIPPADMKAGPDAVHPFNHPV